MTWPEILEYIGNGGDAAILPLGATEQHGPHLGTGMDSVLAAKVCAQVGKQTGVPVLPIFAYGCSHAHSHRWPGTVSLSPATYIAVLSEMADWLYRAGIRRLFMVNAHVGNDAPMRCALDTMRSRYDDFMVAGLSTGKLTPVIEAAFTTDADDWHANAAETSLMMSIAPHMVRPDRIAAADDPDRTGECVFAHPVNRTSRNGVTGRPSEASEFAGQRLFEHLVAALVQRVECGLSERAPLDASFFEPINH